MQLRYASALLAAFFLIGCGASKPETPKPKINLSITEFESRAGVQPGEAETVADALGSLLAQTGRFTMIDRKQLATMMQEQSFQQSQGVHDGQSGHILLVKKFLTGSLSKLGDNYVFSVKLTDVESSRIELSLSKTYDDDLEDMMDEFLPGIVHEILSAIDRPLSR
jgi:TolB-like protein